MINENVDNLLRVKEFEINELQNVKIRALQNELEEKNKRIYDLIQQNENFTFNEKCKFHSLKIQDDSMNKLSKENLCLKNLLDEKEKQLTELLLEQNKKERRFQLDFESKDLEIKKLRRNLSESLKELELYKNENSSLEQTEKENLFELQDIKIQLENQIKEKENILDKLIYENSQLQQKNQKLEDFKTTTFNENDRSENKYQIATNSLYKEIAGLKKQVVDFETKMKNKKRKNETKLEKLKQNYFSYLEDYEKRHLEQMREMKEINESNEIEVRKLSLENEELRSRIRFFNENAKFSTNEIVGNLEKKLYDLEEKNKQSNNEIQKKEYEIKNLKAENAILVKHKEIYEKNLKDLENEKKSNNDEEERNSICRYDENDFDREIMFLTKIKEKLKNEKYYDVIEKKFQENEILAKNCGILNTQVENLKKENLFLGYEILKLQKKNMELENKINFKPEKILEKNDEINKIEQNTKENILKKANLIKKQDFVEPVKEKKEEVSCNNSENMEKPIKAKNFEFKLQKNKNKNVPIKLPRYENFEKIESNEGG